MRSYIFKRRFRCRCRRRCLSSLILGNLSTDVFEPRTATGSRMFSFLAWFCSLSWTGKLLFLCLLFDVTNAMASKRSKEGKIQLPVDVRGSKTSVLKFPIHVTTTATPTKTSLVHVSCSTFQLKVVELFWNRILLGTALMSWVRRGDFQV